MRPSRLIPLALIAATLGCAGESRVDLLIVGGTVVDGTGGVPRRIDVALDRGRIVALGPRPELKARRTIDASGQIVAPGFVDMHSHADLIALAEPAIQATGSAPLA